jgi:hypothetical protein
MVMHKLAASAGAAIYKRAVEDKPDDELPTKLYLVLLINLIVFLPVFVYVSYTLGNLFPVLAIVENIDPPAYEPVSLNEDSASHVDDGPADRASTVKRDGAPKPISSSLRSLNRLLFSVAGWRANFRGIWASIAFGFVLSIFTGIFSSIPFVPGFVGIILANLALVQLSAAWVHIVISPPNPAPFWRRLPPFKRTFEATALPVVIYGVAYALSVVVPELVGDALGFNTWRPTNPGTIPDPGQYDRHSSWKGLILLLVTFAVWAIAFVPATVLLVRVQASLLPPDEDTIIPFDRSYDGTIEPAIVGGKGYVTMKDAIRTFPRSSWIRIYVLQAKIFGLVLASVVLFAAVVAPQVWLIAGR